MIKWFKIKFSMKCDMKCQWIEEVKFWDLESHSRSNAHTLYNERIIHDKLIHTNWNEFIMIKWKFPNCLQSGDMQCQWIEQFKFGDLSCHARYFAHTSGNQILNYHDPMHHVWNDFTTGKWIFQSFWKQGITMSMNRESQILISQLPFKISCS